MKRLRVFRQKEKEAAPVRHEAPVRVEEKSSGWKETLYDIYFNHYKRLLIIPIILLILALGQIGYQVATTGDFIMKGVSLQGGVTVSFITEKPLDLLRLRDSIIAESGNNDIVVRKVGQDGVIIEAGMPESEIDGFIDIVSRQTGIARSEYSIEIMGSALGKSFFSQALLAVLIAFLLMGLVVFVIFRTFVPSMAIMLAAFSDIVIPIAVLNIMGVKISTAGIAAFLMLIGYSVDTDILLTIRVLKRKEGTVNERIISSIKTGMTMTITAIASTLVVLIFSRSEVLTQIMLILFIGLMADLVNTWIQNVAILKWYLERKHEKA
jgi:preprotein translocase subunit SecF